jgi:hypothetical protein
LAFSSGLALVVFVVPWYFPGKTPIESVSWTYGFSNQVAVLGVGGLLAVLLGWLNLGGKLPEVFEVVRRGLFELTADLSASGQEARGAHCNLRLGCVGSSIIITGLVLAWFAYLPFAYFGESGYFLARLDWMVMGKVPYRDFVFNYGPLELFPSYWIYWLGAGALSVEQAYATSLALHWVAGFYLLYFILSRLSGPFARLSVFMVIAASAANFSLGLSYTPVRFLIGAATVLRMHQCAAGALGQRFEKLRIAAAAFVAPLISFAISPEMGIAAWLGCGCWFLFQERRLRWGVVPTLLALPATAIIFSKGYFESMLSFGGGGYSFPIYPTAFMLFFLGMVFSVSPALAFGALVRGECPPAAGSQRRPGVASTLGTPVAGPGQRALMAALCVVTGLPIVAALGRCDPGHIVFNGMGIALLFLSALSRAKSRWFAPALIAYGLIFVLGTNVSACLHSREAIQRATGLRAALGSESVRGSAEASQLFNGLRYSKRLPVSPSYRRLFEFPSLGVPLGCDEALERFLKMSGKLGFEYHMQPGMDVLNFRQLQRKLADMEKLPVILVPEIVLQPMGGIDLKILAKADSDYLSGLMLYPVALKPLNQPFDLTREIVKEIKKRYTPVCVVGSAPLTYTVLKRKE